MAQFKQGQKTDLSLTVNYRRPTYFFMCFLIRKHSTGSLQTCFCSGLIELNSFCIVSLDMAFEQVPPFITRWSHTLK